MKNELTRAETTPEQGQIPAVAAVATGSACLATAMPLGKRMLLRDAPPILWRALGEDLNKRIKELSQ